MSCRRDSTPPTLRPPVKSWNWQLSGLLDKLTLNTGADAGEKRGREDEATADLIREAERLLVIVATAPLNDLSAMIARLLELLQTAQLSSGSEARVRQLVARLQAAKRSRDAAATQLEEDLEEPTTRAELLLDEAQERLREGRYGNQIPQY